ncbi:MAG: hypothetical protein V3U96_13390 [Paracoccaceae bacterium]
MNKITTNPKANAPRIVRSAKTGQFVSVQSTNGNEKSRAKSVTAVKGASARRRDALKRLADR